MKVELTNSDGSVISAGEIYRFNPVLEINSWRKVNNLAAIDLGDTLNVGGFRCGLITTVISRGNITTIECNDGEVFNIEGVE